MRKKSSMRGTMNVGYLRPVPSDDSKSTDTSTDYFGKWNPESAKMLHGEPTAHEVWLISQAQSYLGKRHVTIAEANELWKEIDIISRRPRAAEPPAPSRFARALRALRLAVGTILMGVGISACNYTPTDNRDYDPEYSVACYTVYGFARIATSCVQVRQGTKP